MNDEIGYRFIRVGQPARKSLNADRSHNHLKDSLLSGTLTASVTTITPLHVGTGDLLLVEDLPEPRPSSSADVPLIAPFFRENSRLVIPGSSLKGVFRNLYEAVTLSCLAQADPRPDGALRSCFYRADNRRNAPNKLCPACRLFGGQGYMGQVYFRPSWIDAQTYVEFSPRRWAPEIHAEDERKIYTHLVTDEELVEPLESLASGTVFQLVMDFRNLEASEVGVLLMLMGQNAEEPLYPKFGAVKAHGFGAVEISNVTVTLISENDYLQYEPSTRVVNDFDQFLKAARESDSPLRQESWTQIKTLLGQRPQEF